MFDKLFVVIGLIDCLSVNVVSRLESHTTQLVVMFDRLCLSVNTTMVSRLEMWLAIPPNWL